MKFEYNPLFKVQYPRAPDNKPMEATFVSGESVPEFTDDGEIDLSVVIPAYNEKGKKLLRPIKSKIRSPTVNAGRVH